MKGVLGSLGYLYQTCVCFRHFLYDRKIWTQKFAPLPVVSIGNIVAGGSGKTQVALLLAEQLADSLKVAILSRGYRGRAEGMDEPLLVDAHKHPASLCGDEPLLLASRLESSLVIVNKNRFKSAWLAKNRGAQILLLDDGMQHRALHRNFEIVVLDAKTSFQGFLPKGRLREDPRRLEKADLILFVGSPDEEVIRTVSALSSAPQVVSSIVCRGVFNLDGTPITALKERRVGVFCGIGNPTRFVKTVEELGAQVVATHFSPDHRLMGEGRLRKFAAFCKEKGVDLLLCTEKDKVKLSPFDLSLPIGWVKADLEIVKNQDGWKKAVNEMKLLAGAAQ